MSTAQRNDDIGLIDALCRAPTRYSFYQAVELLLGWMRQSHHVSRRVALDRMLRFENSRDLAFPAGDLGAIDVTNRPNAPPQAVLTALFTGLTGTHGTLPYHYTARLADDSDGGTQALLDVFSNRFVRHFHVAWRKHRVELPSLDHGTDELHPLLLGLSGNCSGTPVDASVAARYTAAFRQRPASAAMLQSVLADFFQLPVTVESNRGYLYRLQLHQRARLGTGTATLDGRLVLGQRIWRRDARVDIRFGPLSKKEFDTLLPDGTNVPKLRALLSMLHMPTIDFEIILELAAAHVRPNTLTSRPGEKSRLGYDAFLVLTPGFKTGEKRYLLPAR